MEFEEKFSEFTTIPFSELYKNLPEEQSVTFQFRVTRLIRKDQLPSMIQWFVVLELLVFLFPLAFLSGGGRRGRYGYNWDGFVEAATSSTVIFMAILTPFLAIFIVLRRYNMTNFFHKRVWIKLIEESDFDKPKLNSEDQDLELICHYINWVNKSK